MMITMMMMMIGAIKIRMNKNVYNYILLFSVQNTAEEGFEKNKA